MVFVPMLDLLRFFLGCVYACRGNPRLRQGCAALRGTFPYPQEGSAQVKGCMLSFCFFAVGFAWKHISSNISQQIWM